MTTHPRQRGFTLIELLIVVAIIGILAAIAVPSLLRSRISANEASAIATVRAVSSANSAYQSVCGGYAVAFNTLYTNRYLPDPLGGGAPSKSGYQFTMAPAIGAIPAGSGVGMCVGAHDAFFALGMPIASGQGVRSFAVREPGTIFQDISGNIIPDPPVISPTVTVLQ